MRMLNTILLVALAVSPALGDDAVRLTFDAGWDLYPSWSPDGTRIAFNSERTTVDDIYTVLPTGGGLTRITFHSSAEIYPDWSPDSSTIVYFRSAGDELYKIPSTGGTATRFTYDDYWNATPSWSSDNTKIAYSGWYLKGGRAGDSIVYWVPADDGSAGPYVLISGGDNLHPDWKPGNSNMITLSRSGGAQYDIWTKVIGGDAVNITDHPASDANSSWSPNGKYLAFGSDRGGNSDIWIMSATGSNLIQVTDDPGGDGAPDWSPDGDKIVFHSNRSGGYDIYVIDVSGLVNIESASLGEIKAHYATDEMKGK